MSEHEDCLVNIQCVIVIFDDSVWFDELILDSRWYMVSILDIVVPPRCTVFVKVFFSTFVSHMCCSFINTICNFIIRFIRITYLIFFVLFCFGVMHSFTYVILPHISLLFLILQKFIYKKNENCVVTFIR